MSSLTYNTYEQPEAGRIKILKAAFYGLLLYIPTLFFASTELLLLYPIGIVLIDHRLFLNRIKTFRANPFAKKWLLIIWFPAAIIIFGYINKLINGLDINGLRDLYAPFLLIPLLIVGAEFIQNKLLVRFFIFFILIEVVFCFAEYLFGVRSFFINDNSIVIHSKELLYDSRVYGLSSNSSIIGLKLFCAVILLGLADFSKWTFIAVSILICFGVLITFNRAVIVAFLVFLFLLLIQHLIVYRFNLRKLIFSRYFNLSIFIFAFIFIFNKEFTYQFSRGGLTEIDETIDEPITNNEGNVFFRDDKGNVQFKKTEEITNSGILTKQFLGKTRSVNASGRDLIWANYAYFFENNILFGNGSDKLMFTKFNPTKGIYEPIHAHNSYLMLLTSNGLLITLLWIVWLFFLWKRKNIVLIVTVLFYSLFQYGIFWGFSLLDVIFVSLIMSSVNFIPVEYKKPIKRN